MSGAPDTGPPSSGPPSSGRPSSGSGDRSEPTEPRLVAVVDVDGVLADVRHRLHHVAASPKDWKAFFAAAPGDPLLAEGEHTVRRLAEVYDVVYVSGRPESCRRDTERWFAAHDLPVGPLLLRPAHDHRPAPVLKVAVLRRLAETRTVVVLVDDDPAVCAAALRDGFDVLPATWMGEHPTLREAQDEEGRT